MPAIRAWIRTFVGHHDTFASITNVFPALAQFFLGQVAEKANLRASLLIVATNQEDGSIIHRASSICTANSESKACSHSIGNTPFSKCSLWLRVGAEASHASMRHLQSHPSLDQVNLPLVRGLIVEPSHVDCEQPEPGRIGLRPISPTIRISTSSRTRDVAKLFTWKSDNLRKFSQLGGALRNIFCIASTYDFDSQARVCPAGRHDHVPKITSKDDRTTKWPDSDMPPVVHVPGVLANRRYVTSLRLR